MIRNLFVFHGADHKVGTTMISQSVAEMIACRNQSLKILFVSLNGRESTEYVREAPAFIDTIKNHMVNRMINGDDFMRTCKLINNLYMMSGISNELEERHYHPEMASYLLEEVAPEFDLMVADGGNAVDNGLAVGALSIANEIYYLITQQESVLKRYEKLKPIYDTLGVNITSFLVNKFYDQDPYSLQYIEDRLQIDKGRLKKIEFAGYARQAEMDYKTLLEYKNEKFSQDILEIANNLLEKSGFDTIVSPRKKKWKSFI